MLQFISTLLSRFRREDENCQTLVEYGLLLAFIAIIVIVALSFLGPIVSHIFHNVGKNLQRFASKAPHVTSRREHSRGPSPGWLECTLSLSASRWVAHESTRCASTPARRLLTAGTMLLPEQASQSVIRHPLEGVEL